MVNYFDHERLDVYQESINFISWAGELIQSIPGNIAVKSQLDRASTSIPLNIAEGNGKFSVKDRCRFLDIAYGSAVESSACLDVLLARKLVQPEDIKFGKESLKKIVSMLIKLRGSLSNRLAEESVEYQIPE